MAHNDKKIFSVLGKVVQNDNRRRLEVNSPTHLHSCLNRLPLGKQITVTFSEKVPTRSEGQLAYHWVLMAYIADHCGYKSEDVHDAVMRVKFGTKHIKIGNLEQEVRRSISDSAKMPLADCMELIDYDLELCQQLEIHVPTPAELGYISNYAQPLTPVRHEQVV
jgi:hypothetical protein